MGSGAAYHYGYYPALSFASSGNSLPEQSKLVAETMFQSSLHPAEAAQRTDWGKIMR